MELSISSLSTIFVYTENQNPMKKLISFILVSSFLLACTPEEETPVSQMEQKVNEYAEFTLNTDLSHLTDNQRKMIPILIEVADLMDDIFWQEAYGDKEALLASLDDEAAKAFVKLNYGPWDRLGNNEPFLEGVGAKPEGAQYYPLDMTKDEFEAFDGADKNSLYTVIRRDEDGSLKTVPFHTAFKKETDRAAELLLEAASLADDEGFMNYLTLRSKALLSDEYFESDMAWMDMKSNLIDFVVGPIENYEDRLYSYKAAHEAYVLIKDTEWSKRLEKFVSFLPELQANLPVADEYKKEEPGTDSVILVEKQLPLTCLTMRKFS
jgi:hypothetical protein